MNTYKVTFLGREKGAISIRYEITDTVTGDSIKEAELALYDKYEHISIQRVEILKEA